MMLDNRVLFMAFCRYNTVIIARLTRFTTKWTAGCSIFCKYHGSFATFDPCIVLVCVSGILIRAPRTAKHVHICTHTQVVRLDTDEARLQRLRLGYLYIYNTTAFCKTR